MSDKAKQYAATAAEIGRIADSINPRDGDPYEQARKLIVFYLRSAARKAREIGESIAAKEGLV